MSSAASADSPKSGLIALSVETELILSKEPVLERLLPRLEGCPRMPVSSEKCSDIVCCRLACLECVFSRSPSHMKSTLSIGREYVRCVGACLGCERRGAVVSCLSSPNPWLIVRILTSTVSNMNELSEVANWKSFL